MPIQDEPNVLTIVPPSGVPVFTEQQLQQLQAALAGLPQAANMQRSSSSVTLEFTNPSAAKEVFQVLKSLDLVVSSKWPFNLPMGPPTASAMQLDTPVVPETSSSSASPAEVSLLRAEVNDLKACMMDFMKNTNSILQNFKEDISRRLMAPPTPPSAPPEDRPADSFKKYMIPPDQPIPVEGEDDDGEPARAYAKPS